MGKYIYKTNKPNGEWPKIDLFRLLLWIFLGSFANCHARSRTYTQKLAPKIKQKIVSLYVIFVCMVGIRLDSINSQSK